MCPSYELVVIEITEEEIKALAEAKVMNDYTIDRCQVVSTTYTTKR